MMRPAIVPPPVPDSPWSWLAAPKDFVLDNGLHVIAAERSASLLVELRFILARGFAGETRERVGLAGLATAMFAEGALRVGGARLDAMQESLGASFGGRVFADGALIEVSALAANVTEVLSLCAALLANPEFDDDDLERVREKRLALIAYERQSPLGLATRLLPPALYGEGHPYARPMSGSGNAQSVGALTANEVREYYAANLRPERVTMVMAGPLRPLDAAPLLERTLGRWRVAMPAADDRPPTKAADSKFSRVPESVVLVDRPRMEQAAIVMGLPTVARACTAAEALMVADAVVAGTFASRLNLKLREERGWTYGVRSALIDARECGTWLISSFVRRDRAAAAMAEIAAEVGDIAGPRPCSEEELRHAVDYLVARTPGTYESCAQIADLLARDTVCGLPMDYRRQLNRRLRGLGPDAITEACRQIRAQAVPRWVIVADAADAARQLREAGITTNAALAADALP
ncbi:MAG TPA: pitrilysin family protein [Candidatus Binataceae bacterium]|jgi:predicted Zn-dependent peptidase|nr:pitrilysin family protein [Candidatus Binataceae bacterium]